MAKSNKPQSKSSWNLDAGIAKARSELGSSALTPERRVWVEKLLLGTIPQYTAVFLDRFCRDNRTVSETVDIVEILESLRVGDLEAMHHKLEESSLPEVSTSFKAAEAMRVVDSLRSERLRSRR
jgi:hypothetical protein